MKFCGLLLLFSTGIAASPQPINEYVVDCLYFNSNSNGVDSAVTFLCDRRFREITYFQPDVSKQCSNNSEIFRTCNYIGTIHFHGCQMDHIPYGIFAAYRHLHTLDISSMELSTLRTDFFTGASPLTALNASNNRLETVRPKQFAQAPNLQSIDLSYNRIHAIDEQAFDDCCGQLRTLDVSHNHIQFVSSTVFARLSKLFWLNLSHNNLAAIANGTFAHQPELKTLILSHNRIQVIDLDGAMPRFSPVEIIEANGNQLAAINGYAKFMFPSLKWIEVQGNNLSCEYRERSIPLAGFSCTPIVDASSVSNNSNASSASNGAGDDRMVVLSSHHAHVGYFTMIFGILSFVALLMVAGLLMQMRTMLRNDIGMRACHYSVDNTDGIMGTAAFDK